MISHVRGLRRRVSGMHWLAQMCRLERFENVPLLPLRRKINFQPKFAASRPVKAGRLGSRARLSATGSSAENLKT